MPFGILYDSGDDYFYVYRSGFVVGTGSTATSKSYYGNMLRDGHLTGANFLLPETFDYAQWRISKRIKGETIDAFRLSYLPKFMVTGMATRGYFQLFFLQTIIQQPKKISKRFRIISEVMLKIG